MEFVTFEIAKKLKEKGFREKCFAIYTPYSRTFKFNEINVDKRPTSYNLNIEEFRGLYNYYKENNIDAPTISQVLKWLREEEKILITIMPQEKNLGYDTLCFSIYRITEDLYQPIYNGTINTLVDSYEETALAGIEYALDNLI
jgi:hypothetical protein